MSTRSAPILIYDVEAGEEREAELLYHLSYRELQSIDQSWKPYLDVAELEAEMRGKSAAILPDTIGWNWARKLRASTANDENWEFYGIRYRGVLQGALVVDLTPQVCDASIHKGQSALCVEFIATAPWNYRPLMDGLSRKPFLKAVGPKLIHVGIALSRHIGCEGRLILYSVHNPDTQNFYEKLCGMIRVGPVEYHGELLCQFEMTAERANDFIGGS